ncbi:MAG: aminodeoxychorismate synthase component I [Steroidobacteraceae bacterium]
MTLQIPSHCHVRPVKLQGGELRALHAADPLRFPALLESTGTHERLGRYDLLFGYPQTRLSLRSHGSLDGSVGSDFLAALDQSWLRDRVSSEPSDLPFTGGWLLYLGYELAQQIERRLPFMRCVDDLVATAVRIPAAVVRDRIDGQAWIVAENGYDAESRELERELVQVPRIDESRPVQVQATSEEDPARFIAVVERCQEYIRAGDIYQANLSRRWQAELSRSNAAPDLYQRLRRANPAPFGALAQLGRLAIASSSPERLIQVRDGWIASRPIAGTRPRSGNAADDVALLRELHEHPKERAEHIMLIDLERNDLGRLCQAGTVEVDEYMTIETYAHVHHIVSNVRGRLRPQATPGQIIAATFPGGTITGCPKVRCMQIITELEQAGRGPYTGSLGYLNRDGSMDLNILIRTLEVRGQQLSFRAGAGIVADSIPERELAETRAKARGLLQALEIGA